MKNINSKYTICTAGVYWEKEYSITPKIEMEVNLALYENLNDNSQNLYDTWVLYSYNLPKPKLVIAN